MPRSAEPKIVIAYAAAMAAEIAARLGIEGGDPFETYRRSKEQARARLAALLKSALRDDGHSGKDAARISEASDRPRLGRFVSAPLGPQAARFPDT